MEFIYRISWYESNRHRKSHTDMYFLKAEDTHWAFDHYDNIKVEYIRVPKESPEYMSAVENSNITPSSIKTI